MSQFGSEYFKLSPELLCVLDLDGNFIELNPAWTKTLGWEIQDFLQTPFVNFVLPDDKEISMDEVRKLFSIPGYSVSGFENRYRHKDGSYRWLQWSASLIPNDKQILCVVRDITTSKRESLLFAETQEVSLVGSWELDLSNNDLYWSQMCHQIHETDPLTFKPNLNNAFSFYDNEAKVVLENHFKKMLKNGEGYDVELPFTTAKGRKTWIRFMSRASIRNGVVYRVFGTMEDVTKKKFEKSHTELIFESGNFGTWDWDLETNAVYFNERFCSMIGIDHKTVKHELATWDSLTHPQDKIVAYKDISDYLEGRSPFYRNVHRMKHSEGHWVWILDQGKIVEYRDGRPIRFSGTHTDITYLKELESEKILLNDRFKLVLAAIKFGVWDMNLENNVLTWDESMFDLFQVDKKSFTGNYEAWASTIHPEDKQSATDAFLTSLKHEDVDFDTEFRIITSRNEIRHIAAKGYVERDSAGNAIRVTGINWDITKEVEQEKLFETIVNNIPIMITFYDRDGTVEWINPYWTEVLGWTLDDLNNGHYDHSLFLSTEDQLEVVRFMNEAPNEWREFSLINKNGGINHTVWTNVKLSDGKVIGIGQDIGEKKMQEELIKNQQARMVSSAKLSSLGEMASGIAHEINNPLAIIKGKAYQLIKKLEAGDIDVEYLIKEITKIEHNSLRIVKIIKGLRTFSRHGDNDPYQQVTFKSIYDDVLELCHERFKHQGVALKTSGDLSIMIDCQVTQIAQVLLNLINNAHDAVALMNNPWVEVHIENNDNATSIYVTDSGNGISEEVAQKIMQPFFTTKDVGTGTGLGLSISKGIIEMHGGTLFLDRFCQNTRFVIQLPVKNIVCQIDDSEN